MRPLALALLALLLRAAPAFAFEDFSVVAHGASQEGKSPPQELEGNTTSTYNATLTWKATADRGIFRSRSKVENDFSCHCTPQIFPGADRAFALFHMLTIDGPPGPVSGTMHFTLEGKLEHAGEYPWGASIEYQVYVNDGVSTGSLYLGSDGLTGSGAFAGETSPTIDRTIDIPFAGETGEDAVFVMIILETSVGGTGYGSGYNMGSANFWDDLNGDGLGGLHLRASGPAVTLPAGYLANSESMGIVDNHWVSPTVGVPVRSSASGLSLALGTNPVRGGTTVGYTLPHAGAVRIDVVDLQGRVVAVLDDGWREAGAHSVAWTTAGALPGGLYFLRASFEGASAVRKVTVLR